MKRQQSKDRQGKERKGKARQGKARTGKARKGSKESNEAFDVILEAIVCRVKGSGGNVAGKRSTRNDNEH